MAKPPLHDAEHPAGNPEPHRVGNSEALRRALVDRRAEFVEQKRTHADPTYDAVVRSQMKPSSMKILSVDDNEQKTAIHIDPALALGIINYLADTATVRPTRSGAAWRALPKEKTTPTVPVAKQMHRRGSTETPTIRRHFNA